MAVSADEHGNLARAVKPVAKVGFVVIHDLHLHDVVDLPLEQLGYELEVLIAILDENLELRRPVFS